MTFIRGEKVVVNRTGKGQCLVTLLGDLNTEDNDSIEVEFADGTRKMLPVKSCKFKPYTGEEV